MFDLYNVLIINSLKSLIMKFKDSHWEDRLNAFWNTDVVSQYNIFVNQFHHREPWGLSGHFNRF